MCQEKQKNKFIWDQGKIAKKFIPGTKYGVFQYLKEKKAFSGVSLGFMLPQNPKNCIYLKKREVKMRILPGTECKNKKK